jgi:xylulokinase
VRADGSILAKAQRPHEVSRPRPGWVEVDAEILWADFTSITRELVGDAGSRVAGVCCSGLGPCVLALGEDLQPLRPVILYGVDTRATREIKELTERYGADAILRRCGSPLTSQAVGPKLLWLRRNEPEVWAETRRVVTVSGYLVGRLTGEYVLDHHSASQSDPLYDIHANAWIDTWAGDIAPGLELPRLLWPPEVAGRVTRQASVETGLPAGTPVAAGTIDTWAEAASVGVAAPGDMMLMYGTTMFLVEVLSEARPHPQLWSTSSLYPGTHNLAGGMATSGALTTWLQDLAGEVPFDRLEEEASHTPVGANGLVVLPYFAGERSPLFDPDARGVVCGLTIAHERGHLFRALLEGTGYGVRHILEVMVEAGGGGRRIVAVGGGTKGTLWPQIVSGITGRRQELPRETTGASYGDAQLAAIAVGAAEPGSEWNEIVGVVEPGEGVEAVYDQLYGVYRELYPATRRQVHTLAVMQNIANVVS